MNRKSRKDPETVREYLARHDLRSNNREYLDWTVVRVTENPDHVRIWVSDSVCVWAVPEE